MVEAVLGCAQGTVVAAAVDVVRLDYAVAPVQQDLYDLVVVAVGGQDEWGDVRGEGAAVNGSGRNQALGNLQRHRPFQIIRHMT